MGWYDKSQAELADAFARWYAAYHEPWDSGFSCRACAMGKDSRAGHQFRLATCFVKTPPLWECPAILVCADCWQWGLFAALSWGYINAIYPL